MNILFQKYRSVIRFVVLFFGSYLLLSFLYMMYLKNFSSDKYFPDYITHLVSVQSNALVKAAGYDTIMFTPSEHPSIMLTINDSYSVGIVEGCNSISIIILFFSFVIAFAEGFKKTFLFLLAGGVLIYSVNILRIAFLIVILYKFPNYEKILHSVVFPGIIYGLVFILWLVWVSMLKKPTNEET